MARRPYIDPKIISFENLAVPTQKDGYIQHCPDCEPVGMDGRNDWFRWHCRDCGKKFISPRSEKRMKHYECTECGATHFIYKGFFAPADKDHSVETVPLRPDEVDGTLCRIKLAYAPSEYDVEGNWRYGLADALEEQADRDMWEVVEPLEVVEANPQTV